MFDATRFRQAEQQFQAQITAANRQADNDDSDEEAPIIDAAVMISADQNADLHAMTYVCPL